jgi:FimV-like protein
MPATMQFPEFFTPFFDSILETLQPLIIFFSTHPKAHFALIFFTTCMLVTLLFVSKKKSHNTEPLTDIEIKNISAIAGDDVFATQLDLAKAYIEMNKKKSAKKMLDKVIKQGSAQQKNVARQLTRAL